MASDTKTETGSRRPTAETHRQYSPLAQVTVLLETIATYLGSGVELISMEGRLAALSLFAMQILALVGAGLLLSSWLLLSAALSVWLVASFGANLAFLLALLAIVNALILVPVILLIRRLSRNLLFRNSRHHFLSRKKTSGADPEYQLNPIQ
jgi:hypothetical protein